MRRTYLAGLVVVLLLAGAGCGNKQPAIATVDMMPEKFDVMPGLKPADEQTWRVFGTDLNRRIDTHWRTTALFDQVEAYYLDLIGKNWGLVTHTTATKDEVRIYWGLYADVRAIDDYGSGKQFIAISKAQKGGMTDVEVYIEPKYQ